MVGEITRSRRREERDDELYNSFRRSIDEGKDRRLSESCKTAALQYLKTNYKEDGRRLYDLIQGCKTGSYCSSIYCVECSKRLSSSMYKRWTRLLDKKIFSLTILDGVCEFNEQSVRDWIKRFRRKVELVKRHNKNIYIDGWIEIEVIDTDILKKVIPQTRFEKLKIEYLRQHVSQLKTTQRHILYPHLHGVVVNDGYSMKQIKRQFEVYFTETKQDVLLKNIPYRGQTKEKGLETWSRYVVKLSSNRKGYRKDLYTFKTTFAAENPLPDEEMFNYVIPDSVIAHLMLIHQNIRGKTNKGLMVRSGNLTP